MKKTTALTIAVGTLSASVALIVSFGALLFQGGIIADETGTGGQLLPVQAGVGITGLILLVVAVGLFIYVGVSGNRR